MSRLSNAACVVSLLASGAVSAQPAVDDNYFRNTYFYAHLTKLQAGNVNGQVYVDVEFNAENWAAIKQAGIMPELHLYLITSRGRRTFIAGYPITSSRIWFPASVDFRGYSRYEVAVVGTSRESRIGKIWYEPLRQAAETFGWDIAGARPVRRRSPVTPESIQACADAVVYVGDREKCMAILPKMVVDDPVASIRACRNTVVYVGDYERCLEALAVSPGAMSEARAVPGPEAASQARGASAEAAVDDAKGTPPTALKAVTEPPRIQKKNK